MSRNAAAVCKQPPGVIEPKVDFARCEGKSDCAVVCPENVFDIRRIDAADYQTLRPLQRFKLRVQEAEVDRTLTVFHPGRRGRTIPLPPEPEREIGDDLADRH